MEFRFSNGAEAINCLSFGKSSAAMLLLTFAGSIQAGSIRANSIERFGIAGYIQPVGLHHGFHIESIAPESAASKDRLKPHDLIVKVDGEAIRSLDHLRAVLAEAYADDGEVTITYIRGASLEHRDIKCNVKQVAAKADGDKRKAGPDSAVR